MAVYNRGSWSMMLLMNPVGFQWLATSPIVRRSGLYSADQAVGHRRNHQQQSPCLVRAAVVREKRLGGWF